MITDDVPMGVSPAAALGHVKLVMLLNDVSLRRLIPDELAKGFGFFQGKPRSACSPVAVTPAALGDAWRDGKLHGAVRSSINGRELGHPDAGVEMQFDFGRLIAHAAKTRPLAAGTIVGSGTISNRDRSVGSSCLAEVRTIETLEQGKATTGFLQFGDRVRIEMLDAGGRSIFGPLRPAGRARYPRDRDAVAGRLGIMSVASTRWRRRAALSHRGPEQRSAGETTVSFASPGRSGREEDHLRRAGATASLPNRRGRSQFRRDRRRRWRHGGRRAPRPR